MVMFQTATQSNEADSTAYIDDSAMLFLICGLVVKGHGYRLAGLGYHAAGVTSICHQQSVTLHLQQQLVLFVSIQIGAPYGNGVSYQVGTVWKP